MPDAMADTLRCLPLKRLILYSVSVERDYLNAIARIEVVTIKSGAVSLFIFNHTDIYICICYLFLLNYVIGWGECRQSGGVNCS